MLRDDVRELRAKHLNVNYRIDTFAMRVQAG
jgi:hypothetical protein